MILDCSKYVGPCRCGREHTLETKKVVVEYNALDKFDQYMDEVGLSGKRAVIYDTNTYNLPTLRHVRADQEIVLNAGSEPPLRVEVLSFGFKRGIPREGDLVFDVRFLPNPFYIPELGSHTGLDQDVKDFVLEHPVTKEFLVKCMDMLQFLLPHYITEGKHRLVIAIGCTGGAHPSVAIAEYISARLEELGYHTTVNHRDIALEQAHWETKSEYQKGEP